MKELKTQEAIITAVLYVVGGLFLIIIGYNLALLNFQIIQSVGDLAGRSALPIGSFIFCLLLGSYSLKRVRAKIKILERHEATD